jgi:hypothetical protein
MRQSGGGRWDIPVFRNLLKCLIRIDSSKVITHGRSTRLFKFFRERVMFDLVLNAILHDPFIDLSVADILGME